MIEFGGITSIITSVEMLKYAQFLDKEDEEAFKSWVKEYLLWLETSDFGKEESGKSNNHGTIMIARSWDFIFTSIDLKMLENGLIASLRSELTIK